jgi:mannose-6-phosphate isomerase-like protein (cupin superfamily)
MIIPANPIFGMLSPFGSVRVITDEGVTPQSSLAYVEIRSKSEAHYHHYLTETYYVLEGTGRVTLNFESFPIGPGDTVVISPEVMRCVIPDHGSIIKLLAFCTPAWTSEDEWILQ